MNLYKFCREETRATELVGICKAGWLVGTVYIDHEDLWVLPEGFAEKEVLEDYWGTRLICDSEGNQVRTPIHYVEVYLRTNGRADARRRRNYNE